MNTDNKRFHFIRSLNSISQKYGIDEYARYRSMGENCVLADYFNGQNKFWSYERDKATGVLINKYKCPKPRFQDKENGFIAVNVEVPTFGSRKPPIIPFFSIAVNGECDSFDDDEAGKKGLRNHVLEISKKSINDDFLTCPDFVNRYGIEKILFKIQIRNKEISSVEILPYITSFDGQNEKLTNAIGEMLDLLKGKLKNSFLQSWCEPFLGTNQVLWCNVRAVDWDYDNLRSHSIFVCIFNTEEEIIDWVSAYGDDVMNIIAMVKSFFIADVQKAQLKEAEKSAKSAIMSRNMSHNLGSHVMAYLKQQLGSVTSILSSGSKVLADLMPDHLDLAKVADVELPFLVGLGRFIGYLQERQDYIATISTNYIPYGAPVNLKDAIYDELNPDLRYLRHRAESSSDTKNRPSNILLNYIAKSEGLSRENMDEDFLSKKDIRLGFVDYSSGAKQFFGLDSEETTDRNMCFASANAALSQMRKINFSLPGGLVGRQAVFSILENLIRNAAKHGNTTSVDNLDFTLDVIDGAEVLKGICPEWEHRICEAKWRHLYEKASDLEDLYILSITDNLPSNQKVVDGLISGLYEPFVDAASKMTTANKGIKEVRISAAWLRSQTDEESYLRLDGKGNGTLAPLVAVELSDEGNLRYLICVSKNKTVAILSEVKLAKKENEDNARVIRFDEETIKQFEKLEKQDADRWTILSDDDLKNCKTSYSFILCPDSDEAFETLRPFTSNRLCRWKICDEAKMVIHSSDETLMYIYRLFTGLNNQSEDIFIDDDRAKKANAEREETEGRKHYEKIRFDSILSTPGPERYLYRTHHATEKEYVSFCTDYLQKGEEYACVEGITGDNSSDRLVRREWLDEKWYYTHLYAFKKKIAIIDERIFKMVHSIDEKRFIGDKMIATKELIPFAGQINLEELKQSILPTLSGMIMKVKLKQASNIEDIAELVNEVPRSYVSGILGNKDIYEDKTILGDSHLTSYYKGKNVDVFTVIKNTEGEMVLMGCISTEYNEETQSFHNVFDKLAKFKEQNGKYILEPVSEACKDLFVDRYDYISIHQGILDKIYENLSIKDSDTEKCKLTEGIHQSMMRNKTEFGKFLPGFVIHSGRAKPTKNDMPQELPFIQYAAIENAVKDCKPMLVELLDFAKYESNNG